MTADDLGLFTEPAGATRGGSRRDARRERERQRRQRRRRRTVFGVTFLVLVLVAGAVWYGARQLLELREIPDYAGTGEAEVIVEVEEGDTTTAIATNLVEQDVVASARAFNRAAESDERIRSVQPGFYQLRARMSGSVAVTTLLDPAARVGQLEIRGGVQLDDVTQPDGTVVPGILSQISQASCATVAGASTCVSPEDLRAAMGDTDPMELGVPQWAAEPVARVDPAKRLEGLVVPGDYDLRPGATAVQLLQQVLTSSSARLQAEGLPDIAANTGYTPYEVLVIASVVEREGITTDFGRVSRVIYNRLLDGMPLQMDSTINYPLDRQEVRTTDGDRGTPGPYNTYLNRGLPPSPIGSPGSDAISSAVAPPDGPWRYFVKCEVDGTSCFSVTIEEHDAARRDALARGVF